MSTKRFRSIALALADYMTGDTYTLLNATAAVQALDEEFIDAQPVVYPEIKSPDGHAVYQFGDEHQYNRWLFDHDYIVGLVLNSTEMMEHMGESHKIYAIKTLRAQVPGLGLKAAKDAVEDDRVTTLTKTNRDLDELRERLTGNPWNHDYSESDQPPF